MKQKLSNDDKGRYLVATATRSQYLLDMKARTVHRIMAPTAPLTNFLAAGFSKLRRDGGTLDLHVIEHCVVRESSRYYIQVRDYPIATLRMTFPVVSIKELEVAESE